MMKRRELIQMAITTLNDVFDEWTTNGIFKVLADNHTLPWSNDADANDLDLDYHGNHSGDKPVSPMVLKLMDVYEDEDDLRVALSDVLYTKYNLTWSRLWDAINEEYDPLHNYDGTETTTETRNLSLIGSTTASATNTHTDTGTVSDVGSTTNDVTHTSTGTVSDSGTTTSDTTHTSTGTVSDSGTTSSDSTHTNTGTVSHPIESSTTTTGQSNIYGFNSDTAVPSDTSTGTSSSSVTSDVMTNNLTETDDVDGTSTNTRTNNLTDVDDVDTTNTNTRTNNLTDIDDAESSSTNTRTNDLTTTDNGTESASSTTADTGTVTTTTTKGGNLGVTTSEQMLTQEFDFRAKYNFFETVYKDIDKVLCLAIY